MITKLTGVGPGVPLVTNAKGGTQSHSPYRFDLLPGCAMAAIAAVLKLGADKYGADNWRNIGSEDHLNHVLQHVFAYLAGDTQDDHAAHAGCRMLMWLEMVLAERQESGPIDPEVTDENDCSQNQIRTWAEDV